MSLSEDAFVRVKGFLKGARTYVRQLFICVVRAFLYDN